MPAGRGGGSSRLCAPHPPGPGSALSPLSMLLINFSLSSAGQVFSHQAPRSQPLPQGALPRNLQKQGGSFSKRHCILAAEGLTQTPLHA